MNYERHTPVVFPVPTGLNLNMMPLIHGDHDSVPDFAKGYIPLMDQCRFKRGEIVYLTVTEGLVEAQKTQRRPGIHTDGTSSLGWGGWGGADKGEGIYLASTDGRTRLWDSMTFAVGDHGELLCDPEGDPIDTDPNVLYWITDRTPHTSLPTETTTMRQFFRLVGPRVGAWFARHSTPNPLGIQPGCPITHRDKFLRA